MMAAYEVQRGFVAAAVLWASAAVAQERAFLDMSLAELLQVDIGEPEVTSQKRRESLNEVPVSVSVLSGEQLDSQTLRSSDDLPNRVASLTVTRYNGATPQYYVRGVGSNSSGVGDDPSVGVFVDGVYVGRASHTRMPIFDLERVEVIRGPQGVLFGKNVVGGAVHFIPVKPQRYNRRRFEAAVGQRSVRMSGYSNDMFGAKLSHRLSAVALVDRGSLRNETTGSTLPAQFGGRLRDQLRIGIGADQSLRLTVEAGYNTQTGPALLYEGATPVEGLGARSARFANDRDKTGLTFDGHSERRDVRAAGHYALQLGAMSLRMLTAAQAGAVGFRHNIAPMDTNFFTDSVSEEAWMLTQEVQLSGELGGEIRWVVGLFALFESAHRDESFDISETIRGLGYGSLLTDALPGRIMYDGRNKTRSAAAFGRFDWALGWGLTTFAGARLDVIRKDFELDVQGGDPVGITNQQMADFQVAANESWLNPSYQLGLGYTLDGGTLLYTSVNTGFKSGAFNQVALNPRSARASVAPERVVSYEGGLKARLFAQRLHLNLSAFRMHYEDLQIFSGLDSALNAPDVEVRGTEAELVGALAPGLVLSAGYSWLDTEFVEFSSGGGMDLKGNRLPRAPEHAATGSARYAWPVGSALKLAARVDYSVKSRYAFRAQNTASSQQGTYQIVDAELRARIGHEGWAVAVWGKNLTDTQYGIFVQDMTQFGAAPKASVTTQGPRRQVGISVIWHAPEPQNTRR